MINPIDNDIYINYKNKSADMKMCHKDTVIMALCYKSLSATLWSTNSQKPTQTRSRYEYAPIRVGFVVGVGRKNRARIRICI